MDSTRATIAPATSARQIATAFEALIRSARQHARGLSLVAQRTLELWSDMPLLAIEIQPAGLIAEERVLVERNAREAAWTLPAFMAGVRAIGLGEDVTADDLAALAMELTHVQGTPEDIERLQSWLLADGAPGLKIAVQTSFVEVFEGQDIQINANVGAEHAQRMAFDAQATTLQAQELREGGALPEARMALELFSTGRASRGFELTVAERALVSQSVSASSPWFIAELDALLAQPALQQCTSLDRLAARLLRLLRHGVDAAVLERLVALHQHKASFAAQLQKTLHAAHMGAQLGAHLAPPLLHTPLFRALVAALPPEQRVELLLGVLERSEAPDVFEGLRVAAQAIGPHEIINMLPHDVLDAAHAAPLLRLLLAISVPPERITQIIAQLQPAAAVSAATSLPEIYLMELDRTLIRAIARLTPAQALALLPPLMARPELVIADILYTVLAEGRHSDWSHQLTEQCLMRALSKQALPEQRLIKLTRTRHAHTPTRVMSLRQLERFGDLDALRDAVRWRVRELFDPPEIANAMRTRRARLTDIAAVAKREEDPP